MNKLIRKKVQGATEGGPWQVEVIAGSRRVNELDH